MLPYHTDAGRLFTAAKVSETDQRLSDVTAVRSAPVLSRSLVLPPPPPLNFSRIIRVASDIGVQAGRPCAAKFLSKDGIITSLIDFCRGSLKLENSSPSLSMSRASIPIEGWKSKETIPESSRGPLVATGITLLARIH